MGNLYLRTTSRWWMIKYKQTQSRFSSSSSSSSFLFLLASSSNNNWKRVHNNTVMRIDAHHQSKQEKVNELTAVIISKTHSSSSSRVQWRDGQFHVIIAWKCQPKKKSVAGNSSCLGVFFSEPFLLFLLLLLNNNKTILKKSLLNSL